MQCGAPGPVPRRDQRVMSQARKLALPLRTPSSGNPAARAAAGDQSYGGEPTSRAHARSSSSVCSALQDRSLRWIRRGVRGRGTSRRGPPRRRAALRASYVHGQSVAPQLGALPLRAPHKAQFGHSSGRVWAGRQPRAPSVATSALPAAASPGRLSRTVFIRVARRAGGARDSVRTGGGGGIGLGGLPERRPFLITTRAVGVVFGVRAPLTSQSPLPTGAAACRGGQRSPAPVTSAPGKTPQRRPSGPRPG